MSIYTTILDFEDEHALQDHLMKHGINYGVIGGEMEQNAPYFYVGSHRIGSEAHRQGFFSLSYAVPWCARDLWLRVDVSQAHDEKTTTVLLNEQQIRDLHRSLTSLLEEKDQYWKIQQDQNVVLLEGETEEEHFNIYVPTEEEVQDQKERLNENV